MITAINSANSFKGFYTVDEDKMSPNQKRTAADLESKLKEEAMTKDFLVRGDKKSDSISLTQVQWMKAARTKLQAGEYVYTSGIKIGSYNNIDQFERFHIQKAYEKKEQQKKDNIFVAIGLVLLTAFLSLATAHYVKNVLPVAKKMNNTELTNDTLKNNFIKKH